MEVQGNMLNPFNIILFYKVVGWFDGQNIGVEPSKPRFNALYQTYTMWNMYIHIYTLYMCVNLQYLGGLWIVRYKVMVGR
jgi:hypothetical protein